MVITSKKPLGVVKYGEYGRGKRENISFPDYFFLPFYHIKKLSRCVKYD